jgi:shikimate dehydrogenase
VLSLGLVGFPVDHSLSPQLHRAAMDALNLAGEYNLYPVLPLPGGSVQLEGLMERLRQGELCGLNVTIPHKQNVVPYLDRLSPAAQAIGAVNTIYVREGVLVGENTDAAGFAADLERFLRIAHSQIDLYGGKTNQALVLGAGGAARAVVYALLQSGWQVRIAARRHEQARQLVQTIRQSFAGGQQVSIGSEEGWELFDLNSQIPHLQTKIDLVVNTTPVGMWPDLEGNPWPQGLDFPKGAVVYDLVYNPARTVLVKAAQAAGLPATTGLGMLVEQAAMAFECWTGLAAPKEVMYQAVSSLAKTSISKEGDL